MVAVKVWLGGEGSCEIGGRADGNERPGVLEALLKHLEPAGWVIAGATRWKHIRKFRAGAAIRDGIGHADLANVRGLALEASEAGCEIVAFARDRDADDGRAAAVAKGIELSETVGIRIVGGLAIPAIEGWILALHGVRNADSYSRQRAESELAALGIELRSPEAYVAVVEAAAAPLLDTIPPGSLLEWVQTAARVLAVAIRGG
jgi:hypothetical protein